MLASCHIALAQEDESDVDFFAFDVESLNDGLPEPEKRLRLDTPRAALESYFDAVRNEDFARAGHALNLESIPEGERAERAPELALKLAFVLRRYNLIEWGEIPDQPDARVLPGLQQSTSPYQRRSVELGEVELDGRPVPISLQRFRPPQGEPVWLFSPFAVERLDEIHAEAGSGLIGRWVPLQQRLDTLGQPSMTEWFAASIMVLAAGAIWLAIYYLVRTLSKHLPVNWIRTGRKVAMPFATLVAAIVFRISLLHLMPLTGPIAARLEFASEVTGLIAGAWLFLQGVSAGTASLSQRYVVPLATDDPENRRIKTTVYVLRRMAMVIVALLSIGYILLRIGVFETFGISILASAGALGVLVAITAQPLLGNMVAGLQIALTDPVRIGDVVVYDGHWATVEDIAFAHTVMRTWVNTSLIVPHSDLLSKPFENWTKEGDEVARIIKIAVDYRVNVQRIRDKAKEILEGDDRCTEAPLVELVEADTDNAVIWVWVFCTTATASWYLHNEVREQLIDFLKDLDDGAYLPRQRHVLLTEERSARAEERVSAASANVSPAADET